MLYASYISKNNKTFENGTLIKSNTSLNEKIQDLSGGKRNTIIDIISVTMESYLSHTLEFRYQKVLQHSEIYKHFKKL